LTTIKKQNIITSLTGSMAIDRRLGIFEIHIARFNLNKIFLSFSFRPENDQLVRDIDRVIRSHGLVPVTGEILGGQGLTQEIQARIQQSDALIAVLTREQQLQGQNVWLPTQWVSDEYGAARARGQLAMAIVEENVQVNGAYTQHEHIKLNRAAQAETFIRLSETIGLWRAEAGRSLEIRLLPQAAASFATSGNARCEYRLVPPGGVPSPWKEGRAARRPGGVFLVVQGVKFDQAIEVKIFEGNSPKWSSAESPQWVHIELDPWPAAGGGPGSVQ
jgi:hypothetical protein